MRLVALISVVQKTAFQRARALTIADTLTPTAVASAIASVVARIVAGARASVVTSTAPPAAASSVASAAAPGGLLGTPPPPAAVGGAGAGLVVAVSSIIASVVTSIVSAAGRVPAGAAAVLGLAQVGAAPQRAAAAECSPVPGAGDGRQGAAHHRHQQGHHHPHGLVHCVDCHPGAGSGGFVAAEWETPEKPKPGCQHVIQSANSEQETRIPSTHRLWTFGQSYGQQSFEQPQTNRFYHVFKTYHPIL